MVVEHSCPNGAGVQTITDDCSESGLINYISDSVEITKEGNKTNLQRDCTNGIRNKVAEHCSEISSLAVGHLAEREDSLDEYKDASPFLHHLDSEGGAAEDKSDFSIEEIKNSKIASLGASAASNEISAQMNGLWKDQSSGKPNMTDLSTDYKVGKEDGCYSEQKSAPGLAEPTVKLESSNGCSVNVHCDNTYMVDSKPDKTFDCSEFVGDVNGSTQLISDLESQSSCPRKVESFMGDSMDDLHIMSEVLLSPEEAEPAIVEYETISNSKTDFVQTGDELKLLIAVNTLTDCSSQCKHCKDTSYVQLPVDNPYLDKSVSYVDCYQNDHVVKSMDVILGSVHEVKGSELGFSCEERPQLVKLLVNISEENPSVEKPNGFAVDVCNKGIDLEVPTIDQVSASQEHIALVMDQMPFSKNPFILDDTRSDDLFELATESYYSEVTNVAKSKLHGEFTSLPPDQRIVSDQISITEGQHSVISDDHILAVSTTCENGFAVGTEDMSVSSTSDPTNSISLHDISVSRSMQEDGEHTSGISFVPSQVFPAEFSTMPTSQAINDLETDVDENTLDEDMSTKDLTADNAKEKRETEDTSVKEMDSILKADNVEEKLTDDTNAEMNAVQHKDDAKKMQADDTCMETSAVQSLKESEQAKHNVGNGICAVGSMENGDADKQTEDTSANEMRAEIKPDYADGQKQTNDTSREKKPDTCSKETYTIQSTDNAEQKRTEDPIGQEGNKDNAEEQKHTEHPDGREGIKENEEISITGAKQNPERIHVPLKVLLAEASVETKVKKTSAKERVLSFRRRVSKGGDSRSPRAGADDKFWSSPAKLLEINNAKKSSKGRKHPWMLFICCHSVH
ncbi:hypothetical protein GUJ93_ZPchr0002g26009 [Zizania palustris]|uniref:Uncharacterized protein n=1 Tax=Zizania palustris TaxID=103762 RepID=A0A8J5VEW8_ZIZPA|nr:hypothetical protein GUJ93_ZPchr0002g26009 [Zizania palustris]